MWNSLQVRYVFLMHWCRMIDAINSLLALFSQIQVIQTSTELVTGPPGKAVHVTLITRRSQLTATETPPLCTVVTQRVMSVWHTVDPKKYAHGFCFAVLCCGYTLTDFPRSIRFTSLALWQSNDCPSASKATLMNMDKYFMWIHYERLHNHNKAKHNKTVCIFLGIYCIMLSQLLSSSMYNVNGRHANDVIWTW